MLDTHHRFVVDITLSLERAHREDFNTNAKNCMTTPREAARVVTATTPKANQIKYLKVSLSYLYLIN
jgi:hypothetical protein